MNRYLEYVYLALARQKAKRIRRAEGDGILIICRHPLGDTVTELPLIRGLKETFPHRRLVVVCSKLNYNMLEASPCIDKLFLYDDRAEKHYFKANLKRTFAFAKEHLWQEGITLAIAPSTCMPALIDAQLALFSGAAERITYPEELNEGLHREYMGSYDACFTKVLPDPGLIHEVEANLAILKTLGGDASNKEVPLWITEEDRARAEELFQELPKGDVRYIAVNMSTSIRSKDWPVERYISVCKRLQERYKVAYLLIGAGDTAAAYAKTFLESIPAANFVNRTTVRELIAVLIKCDFYLGGDTGPMHMAAAYGLRGVTIYKVAGDIQSRPEDGTTRLYPWGRRIAFLQPEHALPGCEKGCFYDEPHCILQVSEDAFFEAMCKQLEDSQ